MMIWNSVNYIVKGVTMIFNSLNYVGRYLPVLFAQYLRLLQEVTRKYLYAPSPPRYVWMIEASKANR